VNKKKQKNFIHWSVRDLRNPAGARRMAFFGSFFQKRTLALLRR
jgi:hypothetical protein